MCNIKDNDIQQKFPKISVGSEMKRPAPMHSVLKWSFEMRLELPVTLYCIVSNCILGQPRSHGTRGPSRRGTGLPRERGCSKDCFGNAWSRSFQLG